MGIFGDWMDYKLKQNAKVNIFTKTYYSVLRVWDIKSKSHKIC